MTAVLEDLTAIRRSAMDLLARREHGRVELTRKLRQRGACPEMIDIALDRLTEEGCCQSRVTSKAISAIAPVPVTALCVFVKSSTSVAWRGGILSKHCVSLTSTGKSS